MKKLLLFDFDGVVVNTLDMILGVMKDTGQETTREEYVRHFRGNFYKNLEKANARPYAKADQDLFFGLYSQRLLELEPVTGILSTIMALHATHTLVIVSSTLTNPIKAYLAKHEVDHYFKAIYGADVHKDKVEKIKLALQDFSCAPHETVFISDTLGDILDAHKAGVDSMAVTWGFHDPAELAEGNPTAIVTTPDELLKTIQNM